MPDTAYIYDALRTPRGKNRGGALHSIKPLDLVVGLLGQVPARNPGLDLAAVDDLVLGVVSPVGEQGGDIARTAALASGLPETVAGVQLNRFCASGLEAVNTGAAKVLAGDGFVLAGGVESMSRVPMGSDGGAIFQDPATVYDTYFVPQGIGADLIATLEGLRRRLPTAVSSAASFRFETSTACRCSTTTNMCARTVRSRPWGRSSRRSRRWVSKGVLNCLAFRE